MLRKLAAVIVTSHLIGPLGLLLTDVYTEEAEKVAQVRVDERPGRKCLLNDGSFESDRKIGSAVS